MSRIVVIEGIGGASSARFLTPAILEQGVLNNPKIHIEFYGTTPNKDTLSATGKQTIQTLVNNGMKLIDKSKPEDLRLYQALAPDFVFLSTPPNTHIPLVKEWLAHKNPPKAILVEKPFTENINELAELIKYVNEDQRKHQQTNCKILAFDFVEVAFDLTRERIKNIVNHLGSIESIQIFLMDNNSGEITGNPLLAEHDDRPITRENRVALLQEGMVLDQLVHIFPPLQNIVDIKTADVTDIKAAQYENAEIKGETFVAVRMLARSKINNKVIPIYSYNGKGIGKIDTFNISGNLKLLMIINGNDGKQIWLNLTDSTGKYTNSSDSYNNTSNTSGSATDSFKLPRNYHAVMENLFLANAEMGQSLDDALVNLTLATKIKNLINKNVQKNKFPTYAVGTKNEPAPTLEKILATIPRLYGHGADRLAVIEKH